MACTQKKEQICAHKKKKRKNACVWRVHTKRMHFFFSFDVYTHTQKRKHVFGMYTKKGKIFVWRVHTKTEQICVHIKEKKKACVWRVHTQTHVFFLFFWRVHSGGNACVWCVHKKGGNIRLACTHKKSGKHVFGVYAKKKRKK